MVSDDAFKFTFYITYALLVTTGTITFIEALSNKDPAIRHIMNVETVISVIAAFFYSQFVKQIQDLKDGEKPDYQRLTKTRYVDWFITTPFMLLGLLLVFVYNTRGATSIPMIAYAIVFMLNLGMLLIGYLGETGTMSRIQACVIGFAFFFALFAYIYANFVYGTKSTDNFVIFIVFFFIWSLYGIVYLLEERIKNMCYNVLDLLAKCAVGITFWLYLTKIIKF